MSETVTLHTAEPPSVGRPIVLTMDEGDLQQLELAIRYATVPDSEAAHHVYELWQCLREQMEEAGVGLLPPDWHVDH